MVDLYSAILVRFSIFSIQVALIVPVDSTLALVYVLQIPPELKREFEGGSNEFVFMENPIDFTTKKFVFMEKNIVFLY